MFLFLVIHCAQRLWGSGCLKFSSTLLNLTKGLYFREWGNQLPQSLSSSLISLHFFNFHFFISGFGGSTLSKYIQCVLVQSCWSFLLTTTTFSPRFQNPISRTSCLSKFQATPSYKFGHVLILFFMIHIRFPLLLWLSEKLLTHSASSPAYCAPESWPETMWTMLITI